MTGLYYYDPWTSVWQSPDPILGEYMSGKTNGGVFNPITIILSPPPKYYINFAKMILFLYRHSQRLVSLFWW